MSVYHFMDRGFPVIAAIGEYERGEFLAVLERTLAALHDLPSQGLLIDVSQSVAIRRRSNDDMYSFGMTMMSQRDLFANRLAIIATTEVTFGLVRMGLARATECGLESQVFRDYERALAWLAAATRPAGEVGRIA
jgi:hypothetical protein